MHGLIVLCVAVLSVWISSDAKASRTFPFRSNEENLASDPPYHPADSLKEADIILHQTIKTEKDDKFYFNAPISSFESFLERTLFIPLAPTNLVNKAENNTYKGILDAHHQQTLLYADAYNKTPYSSRHYYEQMLAYLKPRLKRLLQMPDPSSNQGRFLTLEAIAEFFRTEALIYNRDFKPTPGELLHELILKDPELKQLYEKTNINR